MEFLVYTALLKGKEEVGPLHLDYYCFEPYDQAVVVFIERNRRLYSTIFKIYYRDIRIKPIREGKKRTR